ncbi:MAG: DUF2384 domain-containing protein [Gemmataceae bacterium]|nr:DUF2384 domain-containing protein [Gemmataceae bacterium]
MPTAKKPTKGPAAAGDPFTLGLDVGDPLGVHGALLDGLPFSSFVRFEKASRLPRAEVARLIAVPPRTLLRRQQSNRLAAGESERLFRLATLFRLAHGLFGGNAEAADRWMRTPRPALGGRTPLELAATEIGARQVEGLIHQLEHGVIV